MGISHPSTVQEFARAIAAGDLDHADKLLKEMGEAVPPQALPLAADVHICRRRWHEAACALDRIAGRDLSCELKRNLSRNLACVQQHRPELYDVLMAAYADSGRYRPAMANEGQLTILQRRENGSESVLTPNNDPRSSVQQMMASIDSPYRQGNAVGLCSIGDGYLLDCLAHHPPDLPLGQQQAVFIFEPDAELVLTCLMIHDYTGQHGPVEQMRFQWLVGQPWDRQLQQLILEDLYMPLPAIFIEHDIAGRDVSSCIQSLTVQRNSLEQKLQNQIKAYYEALICDDPASLFTDAAPRKPRVLLLTSRFSTVLQYSTQDAADGFERIGWKSRVMIEPSAYQRNLPSALRQILAEWKPDLVMQIDHLRHEHGNRFPPNLPFICWIQDHLQNLTCRTAGKTIQKRDFVLTAVAPMYTSLYGYPPRQCVAISKLTRVPSRPDYWSSDGDDLVYVSNASKTPESLTEQLLNLYDPYPKLKPLLRECSSRIRAIYQSGGSLPTLHDVGRVLDKVQGEFPDIRLTSELRPKLVHVLFHPLNDALYRHQALRWAIAVADRLGLSLAIYGSGWDQHPDFARYARGPVQYGAELETLTRRTKINLQIVPYYCTHQRLLDGLVAGGFFLIREHPADTLLPELAVFLNANLDPSVQTVKQARRSIDPANLPAFNRLLQRCACLSELGGPIDIIEWIRCCQEAQLFSDKGVALPRLDEVSFSDIQSLQRRVENFIKNLQLRAEIAEVQRRDIECRLSYSAGVRRVVEHIGRLITSESHEHRFQGTELGGHAA